VTSPWAREREERLAKAASNRRRNKEGGDGVPEARPTVKRSKPVRLTVDMPPPLHRRLKTWTTGYAAEQLDVTSVRSSEVVRSLIDLLTNEQRDSELRELLTAAVLEDLREGQQ
jgi:hypothetical protein